ncbi:O-methyltransferase [Mucilaginibacter rubeus]|uniref:O-methyltransferase n=1 Tax=Mucilaginibacter rubeus TaxID=2027860 RepID=A0AAE6MGN3_9SPHI|nr:MULTISPECIES: O-methyltransferase [Mucilaginibacter]QEM02643.1 O-methyltransferase [Mucilaginibacter rubeus]QEM15263.1 O-methyltransferase [Mucilaginibacter gossypii]QTE42012.1 O-methyltransferase [Mucilaginibacter rubeus]QTE48613.1 O-methyltransferase [Mucilaginibacter rubeus]QTE59999.1 O-methyltransferase [Mucilaginibacter rubeus]
MDTSLFESVDQYIGNLFEDEDAVLKGTLKSMEDAGIPGINVSANQGKFLQVLARLCGAKKILEIGALGGYSTIWLARALPADGLLITLELEQAYADVARLNIIEAGLDPVVEIKVGKAMESLATLEANDEGPFDMIFIDADKPPYTEYFEWALKLSRPGTLIVADNVIREGKVLDDNCDDERVSGVQRFNKVLAANQQVTATIIQTVGTKEHDGMAIAVVK